jgi:hypothetical protein
MAQTQDDLIAAVLANVQTLDAGQAPEPESVAAVAPRLQAIVDGLIQRRILSTLSLAAIPTSIFPDLVLLVAEHVAPMFGRPLDGNTVLAIEIRLRELSRLDPENNDFFILQVLEQLALYGASANVLDAPAILRRLPGIFSELAARDVMSVLDTADIPDAAMPDLSRYVAASLASPQLIPVMQMAEQRLRRMQAVPRRFEPVQADYF